MHQLEGDELYHYYTGDGPIIIFEFNFSTGNVREYSVGITDPLNDKPQHLIAAGTWSGALLAPDTSWTLTGAQTNPGLFFLSVCVQYNAAL